MGIFSRKTDQELKDEREKLDRMINEEKARAQVRGERLSLHTEVRAKREELKKIKNQNQPQSFGGFLAEGAGKIAKAADKTLTAYGQAADRANSKPKKKGYSDFNPGLPFGDPFAPKRRRK